MNGCSNSFVPIKLACEGEGEEYINSNILQNSTKKINDNRTYIITLEDHNILFNESNDYNN